jgi:proteasome accessory factor C
MPPATGSGRRTAEERLSRLLVMLPWLMERGEVPLAEAARRFGLTPAEVTRDLELAAMCGLPPFVDEMIDVFIDDDTVFVGVPRLFTRPLRLTSPEGFALVAAGRAAMQLPGAEPGGPLGRGLQKLEAALGDQAVVVDLPVTPALADAIEVVRAAVPTAERLRIEYWTPSRDEVSERTITPRLVFNDRGEWYVAADDGRSGERRTFRIDRMETIAPTGEHDAVEPLTGPAGAPAWFADAGLRRVTLRLQPEARWVIERYPVDEVKERRGGVADATFPVASERWLDRLLVRLGPYAEVRAPAGWRHLGADVAARVLARYADARTGE